MLTSCLLCLSLLASASQPGQVVQVPEGNILDYQNFIAIEYLKDPNSKLTFQDVLASSNQNRFVPFRQESFNYGIVSTTLWLRITLPQNINRELDYIEFVNPFIDLVRLHSKTDSGYHLQQAGDSIAFNSREHPHRTFLFDLANSTSNNEPVEYYLQIKSGGDLNFLINLWTHDAFLKYSANSQILLGLYFGLILSLAFYNFLLYLNLREKVHLYYVLYITTFALFIGCLNGVTYQYLWPGNPVWSQVSTLTFTGLVIFFAFLLSREFLQTSQNAPRLDKLIIFLMGLSSMQAVVALNGDVLLSTKMAIPLGILLPPVIWITGIVCWKSGYRPARYFVLALTFFLITILISGLTHANLLPATPFTIYAIQFGSVIEVILLSWALMDRTSILKLEKEKIQNEYLEKLESSKSYIEEEIHKRTEQLNLAANYAKEKSRELEKANIELKELATRDGLTGLLNHHTFIEQFKHLIEDAKRYEYYLSVLLMDIDNFKEINDKQGHLVGNRVLEAIADIFRKETRESDLAVRYGGEEFVIVLSRTTMSEAMDKAEQLRLAIETMRLEYVMDVSCTVSIGVTTIDWRDDNTDYNKILSDADLAMYNSKRMGKNRITSASQDYKVISNKNETA